MDFRRRTCVCVLWALTFLFSKVSGRSRTSPTIPSQCAYHQQGHTVTSLALPPAFAISNVSPVFSGVQSWRHLLCSLPLPFRCSAQPVLKITHILGLLQMGKVPPPWRVTPSSSKNEHAAGLTSSLEMKAACVWL